MLTQGQADAVSGAWNGRCARSKPNAHRWRSDSQLSGHKVGLGTAVKWHPTLITVAFGHPALILGKAQVVGPTSMVRPETPDAIRRHPWVKSGISKPRG